MQQNSEQIAPVEKIVSILSYLTMGLVGIIFLIFAYYKKKRLRYFFMYNIVQSLIIAIILAIFHLTLDIFLNIISCIKFLDFIAAFINIAVQYKIINIGSLSFSLLQFVLYLLIAYIILGVIQGKIFYVKYLTNFTKKAMERYR